jgi:predicted RND superfamily exporter protein
VEFASEEEEPPIEELPELLERVAAPIVAEGVPRSGVHLAGMVPESVEVIAQARFNLAWLFPVSATFLVLVVFLLFMRLWPVAITFGTALMALIWVFAFAITLDRQINVMMATVPAVIMIISFSDVIHLCTAYVLELRAGLDKREAILKSGSEVGTACFFTSVTTLIGFASLAFVPTPLFRQLGLVLGLGVAVALLLAVTLSPILFWLMPVPRLDADGGTLADRLIDRLTGRALRMATVRAPWVVAGVAVVVAVAGWGITRMHIETDLPARLAPDNPLRQAQAFAQERFAGTNFVDLYLFAEDDRDFLDPERFAAVAELQEQLEVFPEVDRALSLVDLVEVLHRELARPGDGERLPATRALLAQYLILFEMSGGEGLERLTDDERRTIRLTMRLPGAALVETAAVGDRAAALVAGLDGVRARPTGITYLFGKWIGFVVAGQKRGLAFALVTIAIMMMITVRRFGAGLISMIPNALPLVCLGGYLGIAWGAVDSDTLIVAMVAVGIAVDDTIHFLTRLRIETERDGDIDGALRRTFACTGRAIVQTSIVLCAGFLPFAFSDYFTTRIMGTLLPGTLVVALLADLWLATALVKLGVLRVGLRRSQIRDTDAELHDEVA